MPLQMQATFTSPNASAPVVVVLTETSPGSGTFRAFPPATAFGFNQLQKVSGTYEMLTVNSNSVPGFDTPDFDCIKDGDPGIPEGVLTDGTIIVEVVEL